MTINSEYNSIAEAKRKVDNGEYKLDTQSNDGNVVVVIIVVALGVLLLLLL